MDNKWWEYYAVRYFVGTVVGAAIVAFLNLNEGSLFHGKLAIFQNPKDATFLGVGLVAALGFAFCYIASAPVLTLHATRAHLRIEQIKASPIRLIFFTISPVFIAFLSLKQHLPTPVAACFSLAIGIQLGLVITAVFTKFYVLEQFYRNLATARSSSLIDKDKPATPGAEYLTSYRHLREHGNAFLIVLLEGLLAYTLFHSPSLEIATLLLGVWMLPAAAVWVIGSALESRFITTPLPKP